jgi:ribosomal protein L24
MAYTFQVTAKRTIANKIPKGSTVQVIKNGSAKPSPKEILSAYEEQLGIIVKGVEVQTSYFDIVKL